MKDKKKLKFIILSILMTLLGIGLMVLAVKLDTWEIAKLSLTVLGFILGNFGIISLCQINSLFKDNKDDEKEEK